MANAVLPTSFIQTIVGEIFSDELINSTQGDFLIRGLFDRHRDESHIRVWRLGEWFLFTKEDARAMAA